MNVNAWNTHYLIVPVEAFDKQKWTLWVAGPSWLYAQFCVEFEPALWSGEVHPCLSNALPVSLPKWFEWFVSSIVSSSCAVVNWGLKQAEFGWRGCSPNFEASICGRQSVQPRQIHHRHRLWITTALLISVNTLESYSRSISRIKKVRL